MGFLLKISVLMYFHTMRSLAFNDTLHETLHIFRRHNGRQVDVLLTQFTPIFHFCTP